VGGGQIYCSPAAEQRPRLGTELQASELTKYSVPSFRVNYLEKTTFSTLGPPDYHKISIQLSKITFHKTFIVKEYRMHFLRFQQ
jgi:hypothetical protein